MKKNPVHPVHPVKKKNPHAVALGRLGGLIGGKATGKCKARTPAQARAAALAMWAKRRAATNVPQSTTKPKGN